MLPDQQQTYTVSDKLVNTLEHLAAAEPDISRRRWWRAKQSYKESEFQRDANVF